MSMRKEAQTAIRKIVADERLCLPADVEQALQNVAFEGSDDPFLPVPWRFGELSMALHAMEGSLAAHIHSRRTSARPPAVSVDTDAASLYCLAAFVARADGEVFPKLTKSVWEVVKTNDPHRNFNDWRRAATNIYRTRDGNYFHLHGSMNARPALEAIGLPADRDDVTWKQAREIVAAKVALHNAREIDHLQGIVARQAATICHSRADFLASEEGSAIADCPLYELYPLGGSSPKVRLGSIGAGDRPLKGIKVVELTRVIAGPAIGKKLAEYGAEVIRATCHRLPDLAMVSIDVNNGKSQAEVDLDKPQDLDYLLSLIEEADVVIDGYRPGSLARRGISQAKLVEIADRRGRGIVFCRENCFGWHGPLQGRTGWQQISDAWTGISKGFSDAMGRNGEACTPIFPNSDYGTGSIGASGIMAALLRRAEAGGSWAVDTSLSYYNVFLGSLGMQAEATWKRIHDQYDNFSFRHDDDMIETLGVVVPLMFGKVRPDLLTKPGLYQEAKSQGFGASIRWLTPAVTLEGIETHSIAAVEPNGFHHRPRFSA